MLKNSEPVLSADFKLRFWDHVQKIAKRRDSILVNSAKHLLNVGISNVSDENIIRFVKEMQEMIHDNSSIVVEQIGNESAHFFYTIKFITKDLEKAVRLNLIFDSGVSYKTADIFNRKSSAFHNSHFNFFQKMQ